MAQASSIHYRSFLWQLQTAEGSLLLIGGICDETLLPALEQRRRQLLTVSFAKIHDAYDLDAHLSRYLEALGTDITVLGASVFVPGTFSRSAFSRSGGIIGSPKQPHASASSTAKFEELQDGFFLWTQPGGPGVAFRAERPKAEQIIRMIEENHNAPIPQQADQIQTLLNNHRIAPYLIVCDGSGSEGHCWMAVSDGASQRLQSG